MGNIGRPSRGCSTCKRRKIKCDETKPSCSRCLTSGWVCPGYKSETDQIFRDETASTTKKMQAQLKVAPARVHSLSPALVSRATSFFIHQYVFREEPENSQGPSRGNHEYLPALLHEDTRGVLSTIITAAGLAGLANAGNSPGWRAEAYTLYGQAIRKLKTALDDPVQVKEDHTLAALMFMGTFEAIVSANAESMKSFSYHTIAAARCIELRGPFQFRNEVSVKLFLQLRRLIIMTLHQMQEPIPYALEQWSSWVEPLQRRDESPANPFTELNERLAAARAQIKRNLICSPSDVASLLFPIDNEFEAWRVALPPSWEFKSYRSLGPSTDTYDSYYDCYSDLWIASMWNNYRSVRLVIHEHIVSTTLQYGQEKDKQLLQDSTAVLKEMADGVCRSVAFHLGCRRQVRVKIQDNVAIPGGYLLMWPLFLSGMLHTTTMDQRKWISSKLREIGIRMGLQLALSMSEHVLRTSKSFSDRGVWFIGEWYPQKGSE